MADVFCSYKREDRERVRLLAEGLKAHGFTVWWDMDLEGGSRWRQRLFDELQAARCVVVCWGRASLGPEGEFVHDEATAAKIRGVYLPVTLDEVQPPLGFGQVQTLPLFNWRGDPQAAEFLAVVAAVRRFVEARPEKPAAADGANGQSLAASPAVADRPLQKGRADPPRVAVLRFGSSAGNADLADFVAGLGEDMVVGLSRSRLMRLLPAKTSLEYDAGSRTGKQICLALGADYAIQGQLRAMGRRVRLSIHLVRGDPETAVWSGTYDYQTDQLFELLDQIVNSLVSAVELALLTQEEAEAFSLPDEALGTWDLFLRGRAHFWRVQAREVALGRRYLERAIEGRAGSALIRTMLAYSALHDLLLGVEKEPARAVAEAHALAVQAVAADRDYAVAHNVLGLTLTALGRRREALAEQEHALRLNPSLATAMGEKSRLLLMEGRAQEGIELADAALATSPADPHAWLWHTLKAMGYFVLERPSEALEQAYAACVRRTDIYFLHELRAAMAVAAGDLEAAREAFAEARRQMPTERTAAAIRATVPLAAGAPLDRYLQAMRAAGWTGGLSEPS